MAWARLALALMWFLGSAITLARRYLQEQEAPAFELDRLSVVGIAMFVFGLWNLARWYQARTRRQRESLPALARPHHATGEPNPDFDFSKPSDTKSNPSPPTGPTP